MKIIVRIILLLYLAQASVLETSAQVFALSEDPKYLPRSEAFRNHISKELLITYFPRSHTTDSVISKEIYYDSTGKVIEVRGFQGGRFSHRFVYMYTGEQLTSVYEDGIALGYKMDYRISYDTVGNPYEEHRQIQGKPYFLVFRYVFDTTGHLVGINRSFNGNNMEPYLKYYYEAGRLVRKEEFSGPKQLAFAEEYRYPAEGTILKYYLLGNQKIKGSESYFNKTGQMVKKIVYAGEPVGRFIPKINPDRAVRHYEYNADKTVSVIHFGSRRKMVGYTVYNYF